MRAGLAVNPSTEVDDVICALTPEPFFAVGAWYADFSQTTDEEVRELLEAARLEREALDVSATATER